MQASPCEEPTWLGARACGACAGARAAPQAGMCVVAWTASLPPAAWGPGPFPGTQPPPLPAPAPPPPGALGFLRTLPVAIPVHLPPPHPHRSPAPLKCLPSPARCTTGLPSPPSPKPRLRGQPTPSLPISSHPPSPRASHHAPVPLPPPVSSLLSGTGAHETPLPAPSPQVLSETCVYPGPAHPISPALRTTSGPHTSQAALCLVHPLGLPAPRSAPGLPAPATVPSPSLVPWRGPASLPWCECL